MSIPTEEIVYLTAVSKLKYQQLPHLDRTHGNPPHHFFYFRSIRGLCLFQRKSSFWGRKIPNRLPSAFGARKHTFISIFKSEGECLYPGKSISGDEAYSR